MDGDGKIRCERHNNHLLVLPGVVVFGYSPYVLSFFFDNTINTGCCLSGDLPICGHASRDELTAMLRATADEHQLVLDNAQVLEDASL